MFAYMLTTCMWEPMEAIRLELRAVESHVGARD